MLITTKALPLQLGTGFWCEAIAYTSNGSSAHWLGSAPSSTARIAIRWLRWRAGHISDQLDPPAAYPVRCWLADQAEHERALEVLVSGDLYTLTIPDGAVRYLLSARPAKCTPLPRRAW
ncbi:hypothetical protein ACFV5N_04460 [Streptomyces sp. NPDC059853]|uniref:hypothetical protein n=1 Tax=Streptomyces sp. NPDC059853 TaxID=3346973 RepID=UPI00366863EC